MVELQNTQIAYHPASIPDADLIIRGVFSAPLGRPENKLHRKAETIEMAYIKIILQVSMWDTFIPLQ